MNKEKNYNLNMIGCLGDDNYKDKIMNAFDKTRIKL